MNWEITIMELNNHVGPIFKVTRRIPEFKVSDTKFFRDKLEAKEQFAEWLDD